jgi:hypothetical protein
VWSEIGLSLSLNVCTWVESESVYVYNRGVEAIGSSTGANNLKGRVTKLLNDHGSFNNIFYYYYYFLCALLFLEVLDIFYYYYYFLCALLFLEALHCFVNSFSNINYSFLSQISLQI